jgi:hypothetical protein
MTYAPRIILHAPPWDSTVLADFVEDCIRGGVVLICVIGEDCERVEDVIDQFVIGDGSDDTRFILTSSHEGETLEAVRAFARMCCADDVAPGSPIQEVTLPID